MNSHRERPDVERELSGVASDARRLAPVSDDRSAFLSSVCERLAGSDLYAYAWYGTPDVGTDRPDPVAGAGSASSDVPDAAFASVATGGHAGAAFRARSVQTATVRPDGHDGPTRTLATDHGIRSFAVVPVLPAGAGVPYGFLAVYTRRPDAFGVDETALLSTVATAVGRGIETTDGGTAVPVVGGDSESGGGGLRDGAVARAVPELLVVFDSAGRYEEVLTPQYARHLAAPGGLVGRHVREVLPDDAADGILDAIGAALDTGEVREVEYGLRVAGETIRIAARLAPLDPPDGDRVVFAGRHVTERRERERELRRQNERLRSFAGTVSHDLRNPLSVAEGTLDLAREECDSDHLDAVARAHERMDDLIHDLLALGRGNAAVEDPEPVDLAGLVEDCWRNVETSGATLVVEADRTVRADRSRLQRLLENLIRNAVEHGSTSPRSRGSEDAVEHGSTSPRSRGSEDAVEHGSTSPRSRGTGDRNATDGGLMVRIGDLDDGFYVADDGPGIPEEERERVFDTGYSTGGGTGVGLSIVDGIVDAHGWEIEPTDAEGGGARFEITGVDSGP